MSVLAYARVSTDQQAESGLGLDAQRAAIEGWLTVHGIAEEVRWHVDAGQSGKHMDRPELCRLLGSVRRGDRLVVSKLDRLSRSLADFAALLGRAEKEGFGIVCLDLGVDLGTPTGRLIAGVVATVAQFEREMIAARTCDALAQARLRGRLPGRRSRVPRHVQDRLLELGETGRTLAQVAEVMNREGYVTATGVSWGPGSVHGSTRSARMERDAETAHASLTTAGEVQ